MASRFNILIFTLTLLFALGAADSAEARSRGRPRYRRAANYAQCMANSFKPSAKQVSGRPANARVPFMLKKIQDYTAKLRSQCSGLVVQSTFRDCATNINVGGARKSRHLCGAAADTSGCGGNSNPRRNLSAIVCRQMGLTYINEGSGRYPHCQIPSTCTSLKRD